MRNRHCLAGLALATALAACNLSPGPITPLPAGLTAGSPTDLQIQPSNTALPSIPPTDDPPPITPTPTLEIVIAQPKETLVNCRMGPGTIYIIIGALKENQTARIAGRNVTGTWYYIHDPGNPGGFCWVSADLVEVTGNTDSLPVIQPPTASVTDITLTVEPNRIVVACDQFPQVVYMTAQITTDGPALVTYRWEASTGVSSLDNAIAFEQAGTQTIQDFYQIGSANDYWIKLHVIGPNDMSEQTNFRVVCNQ